MLIAISSFHYLAYLEHVAKSTKTFYIRYFVKYSPLYYLVILCHVSRSIWYNDNLEGNYLDYSLHITLLHGLSPTSFSKIIPGASFVGIAAIYLFTAPLLYKIISGKFIYIKYVFLFLAETSVSFLVNSVGNHCSMVKPSVLNWAYMNFINQYLVFLVGIGIFLLEKSNLKISNYFPLILFYSDCF